MNTIEITKKRGVYIPYAAKVYVRAEHGQVVMYLNGSRIEFATPTAHKAGFALVKYAGEVDRDFIVVTVNGRSMDLLPEHASKIGAALLRKSDQADDYQQRMVI